MTSRRARSPPTRYGGTSSLNYQLWGQPISSSILPNVLSTVQFSQKSGIPLWSLVVVGVQRKKWPQSVRSPTINSPCHQPARPSNPPTRPSTRPHQRRDGDRVGHVCRQRREFLLKPRFRSVLHDRRNGNQLLPIFPLQCRKEDGMRMRYGGAVEWFAEDDT